MFRRNSDKAPVAALAAATCGIVALELVLPLTVLQTYDRFIPNESRASLAVFFVFAVVCLLAEAGLRLARSILLNLSGTRYAHQSGCTVMEKLVSARETTDQSPGTGANLALLSTVRGMREMTDGRWLTGLAELSLIPIALGLIAAIAGPLVFIPLCLTLGFAVLSYRIGKHLEQARDHRQAQDTARFDTMVEMFRGLGTIKALSIEPAMKRRYETAKYRSTLAHIAVMQKITRLFDASATFGTFMVMSIIVAGAFLTISGEITAGAMIAAVILSGRCMPPIQKGLGLLNRRQEFLVEKQQVDARLEELEKSVTAKIMADTQNDGQLALEGLSITVENASFLENVDFTFPEREITWVDAPSHAVLTAFYRTLAGVAEPQAGRVLLNGADIRQLPELRRSRQIALLQSETVLYRGTIIDNISRFGSVPLSDVLFIAHHLRLVDDLSALPRGYDTLLRGDGSDPITPGLRHRIALARALAPRPRVVLFNQADAGLDQDSYGALVELLGKLRGHATVVLTSADANLQGLATHAVTLGNKAFTNRMVESRTGLAVARYRELRM